jgi:hypothetical protein
MAIIVKEKEKKLDWFPLGVGLFVLIVLGAAVYFLFLSPAPFIEKLAPISGPETADTFSGLIDPTSVINNTSFSLLHLYVPNPDPGQIGRDNPFSRVF